MNTKVMDVVRIGVSAVAFILVAKVLTQLVHIPGLSDAIAAV